MTKQPWKVTEISRQVHRITFSGIRAGWEQWVLLQSDEHWDNAECDRALLTRHHKEALQKNAPIFKFGDVFCAMQGKWDKRADENQLRPEHRGNKYLDSLVSTASDYYSPFASNIALVTPGNHEGSILGKHQTDLTERLVERLKVKSSTVHMGDYWGYVLFTFDCGKKLTKQMHYHHGYGGGGEVTRGLIDHSRTRGQYHADIYVSGHIHRRNMDENILTECTTAGVLVKKPQIFLRSGTYKDETKGWHAMGGRAARPLGGWWLRFTYRPRNGQHYIDCQEIRAN